MTGAAETLDDAGLEMHADHDLVVEALRAHVASS